MEAIMKPAGIAIHLLVALLLVLPGSIHASYFYGLGTSFFGSNISGDGTVVVGYTPGSYPDPDQSAYWSNATGVVGIGSLTAGTPTYAAAVSGDGSVIVGTSGDGETIGDEAFVWTGAAGMMGLGDLPGGATISNATGISGDGSTVVGFSSSVSGQFQPFYWTSQSGLVGLTDAGGDPYAGRANAISADGNVISGVVNGLNGYDIDGFSWTSADGLLRIDSLPGSGFTVPYATSADGNVIVGYGATSQGYEAFLWDAINGTAGLGDFPGGDFFSRAYDVSADGSTIVGSGARGTGNPDTAFIWDAQHGMRSIQDLLIAGGLDLTGWTLRSALAISDDGSIILGRGINPDGQNETWIAGISAVPLPPAPWLMGSGLLALAGIAKRRHAGTIH